MPIFPGSGFRFQSDPNPSERSLLVSSLRGKRIVFVSPGYTGKRFILEKAHELGIQSVVLDSPGSWTNDLHCEGIVYRVFPVDMSGSSEKVYKDCVVALSSLDGFDGICTFVELSAPLTARLCEFFNVPGHSASSVEMARDKHLTRKAVSMTEETQKYGIRNILIENGNVEFLRRAAETVGFPAVLKPVAGAASLGVQKVGTFDELLRTYDSISALVSNLIVSNGALERRRKLEKEESPNCCLPSGSSKFDNSTILLEEYISGKEVDIDLVLSHGKVTFCEVSDNGPTIEPYFGETYNSCPSLLSETDQLLLKEMAILITTKALGFRSGVFHIEGKMTSYGPRLIEVNCRMGGGPIRAVHLARSGVDLVVEQLLAACGFPLFPPVLQKENLPAVGFINVNARRSGTVACLKFIEQFNQRKGMVYCKSLIAPGEHIFGPEEGQPTWLAEAVFSRETAEEAHRDSLSLYNEIQTMFEQNYVTY